MTTEKFEEILNSRIEKIKETLLVKAKEYARNDDRLHNFRKSARRLGTNMADVLWRGFCEKHLVSLDDMILDLSNGIFPSKDKVDEKLGDVIAYSLLLEAVFIEMIETETMNRVQLASRYIAAADPYIKDSETSISKIYDKNILEALKHYKASLLFPKEQAPEGWENSIDIGKLSLEKRKEIYEQYQQELYPEELKSINPKEKDSERPIASMSDWGIAKKSFNKK